MDFSAFGVTLIVRSVDVLGRDLSEAARDRIAASRAVKVLFRQDEHCDVRATKEAMRRLGINVVFTCEAEADYGIFYPDDVIPSLRGVHAVLPGYVPEYLRTLTAAAEARRPLDVSYRSRVMPFHLGDLGQERRNDARCSCH